MQVQTTAYCLYCYAPLESSSGPSKRCARCGNIHLKADQATYWTRERYMRGVEYAVKLGIVVFLVLFFLALAAKVDMGAHRINTFFIGPLALLGGVLWWTAGLITRKPRYFSPRLLWGLVLLLLIVGPPILFFVMDVIARKETFGPGYWTNSLALALPGLPLLVIGALLHFFGEHFEGFKRRRIASGLE